MTKSSTEISVLELKQLLTQIKDSGNTVCVRVRLIGELWHKEHMRISRITDDGIELVNERLNSTLRIDDLQTIIQFDLDKRFMQYQPHIHYTVRLG